MKSKNTSKIKAILWDMDGVLVDSEQLHALVESETAKHFGIDISPEEVLKKYSGVHIVKEFNEMIHDSNKTDLTYQIMRAYRDKIILEHIRKGTENIPYAIEVLEELSSRYKIGLVSSGERFFGDEFIKKLNLSKYLDVIVFGEDVKNHKPHPEPFLHAASSLNLEPSECIVVEDSESGIKSGKEAGMLVIGKRGEHNMKKDFSQADFVVEDLREIPNVIEIINK